MTDSDLRNSGIPSQIPADMSTGETRSTTGDLSHQTVSVVPYVYTYRGERLPELTPTVHFTLQILMASALTDSPSDAEVPELSLKSFSFRRRPYNTNPQILDPEVAGILRTLKLRRATFGFSNTYENMQKLLGRDLWARAHAILLNAGLIRGSEFRIQIPQGTVQTHILSDFTSYLTRGASPGTMPRKENPHHEIRSR